MNTPTSASPIRHDGLALALNGLPRNGDRISLAPTSQSWFGRVHGDDLPGLRQHCPLSTADQAWLETACERLTLSLRAAHRLLKVARTLADLERVDSIARVHLAEALQYRPGP